MLNLLNRYGITPKAFWVLGIQLMFLTSVALGQTVSGTVTDAQSGETMPGVNVTVQGTQIGTATNADGEYSLTVPSLDATLVFSFVGYETTNEAINGRQTINVELAQAAVLGEDVIVVGYGTQRSQDVTGSVGTVNSENIAGMAISSADQALVGQISGVTVATSSGIPGGGPQIRVRGFSSIGGQGSPLFVVDGFPLPQDTDQSNNPLADIPPSDIENITVLKDASAAAIYGSRASQGVVVITTRSGQSNTRQINISGSTGISKEIDRMKFDMANAQQFADWQRFKIENSTVNPDGTLEPAAGSPVVPDVYLNPQNYYDTNWFDLIRREAPVSYNANVSISGGDENIRSYFSAGFRNDEGIIHETSFQRVSLRANLEATLSDELQVGLNLAPTFTSRNLPDVSGNGRGSIVGQPMMMSPLGPAYVNGELTRRPQEHVQSPGTWSHQNPLHALQQTDQSFTGVRGITNAFVNYTPGYVEGLSARASFNVDWGYENEEFFSPSFVGGINSTLPVTPEGEINTDRQTSVSGDVTVSYNAELGPGTLDALAGWEIRNEYEFGSEFSGEFPGDNVRTMNVASELDGESDESEWSMISYFMRASYNYQDRYVLTGSIRTDGSSRFGTNNRWGTFYTGALAWNMHNEDFFESELFDEFRVRAGYGVSGNNQIGNYSALGTVVQSDYYFEGSVFGGNVIDNLPNPDLTWEYTREWNLGVEANILDYRLGLAVELFQRTTEDMLLDRLVPLSSGYEEVEANLGDMRNRGIEVTLNSLNVQQDDFSWTTDLTWSMYRNEVLSLPNDAPIYSGGGENQPGHVTAVGEPVGMFLGYVVGFNERGGRVYTPSMIADPNVPKPPSAIPGNMIWTDQNEDGIIQPGAPEQNGDFAVIGNPHPEWSFGMVNTVNYRNWSLRVNVTGDVGHDINRREFFRTALNIDGLFNVSADYAEGFYRSEADPGSGEHPTPLGPSEARTRYRGEHTLNMYDGTHLWVRNATLRYNLPAGFAGISSSNVYLSVDNPWIITSYPGNPQANDTAGGGSLSLGDDFTSYPISTQFTLGLELAL